MKIIGDPLDVVGFGLAGVDAVACPTRADLEHAIEEAQGDASLALLIVSPGAAALAPDLIARLRESPRLPITVVLPDWHAAGELEPAA
jgi:vacuolar-type H+-ATPase subunit F/Vma7